MLVHAWNRGAAIMCMTNMKGIDHVIPVMLDTKGNAMFSPLHGPWEKKHIQQACQHISYILINSKNYASGKDQIRAAWATKFSAKNLIDWRDVSQSDQAISESNISKEMVSQNDGTHVEGFNVDSQYVWHDDDPADDDAISTDGEEMKDVEMHESETDNVFLSLM